MKRSRGLRPVSDKRRALNQIRKEMLEKAWGPRENWRCKLRDDPLALGVLGPCFGPVNGHEILKRSRGGSITDLDNIVPLCDFHNGAVENHPAEAARMGLSKHSWE